MAGVSFYAGTFEKIPNYLFFLWVFGLIYLSAAGAAPAIQLEAVPAWNGYFKPGKPTEVKVRLLSDRGGIYSVQTDKLLTKVELLANSYYDLAMPFQAGSRPDSRFINVRGQIDPGISASQQLALTITNNRIIATVSDGLSIDERRLLGQIKQTNANFDFLTVNSESLPHLATSYATIDLLVLSYKDLNHLNVRQINALSSYLTQCGKLIAIDFPEGIYKQFRAAAGCHGAFLTAAANIADLSELAHGLMVSSTVELPEPGTSLFAGRDSVFISPPALLLEFCFGYLLLVFIAVVFNAGHKTFFIMPVLAACVAVMVWYRHQPQANLVSWLEMDNGQSAARYRATLEMPAAGKWSGPITLPVEAAFFAASANPPKLQVDELTRNNVTTTLEFSLLSAAKWSWQAAINLKPPLELKIIEKKLVVTNIGQQTSEAGLVSWQGKIHSLPILTTGQSWSPLDASRMAANTELTRIFPRPRASSSTAVLIPFTANILQFNTNHHGWLLLYGPEAIS